MINEIQFDPATSGTSFVELYNRSTSTPFDLSGWRLDGLGYTFPGRFPGWRRTPIGSLARDRKAFALAYGANPCRSLMNSTDRSTTAAKRCAS